MNRRGGEPGEVESRAESRVNKLVVAVLVLGGLGLALLLWLVPARGAVRTGADTGSELTSPRAAGTLERPPSATPLETPLDPSGEMPARESAASVPAIPPPATQTEAEPVAGLSFHGQVLDALTQRPIAGARALVARPKRHVRPEELTPEEIEREVVSDAEGRFELPLAEGRPIEIGHLLADGYGAGTFVLDGEHRSRAKAAVLELLPGAALEVAVTDAAGAPVPGAKVELVGSREQITRANSMIFRSSQSWVAHTDESGLARLSNLPAEVELAWTVLLEVESTGRAGRIALAPGELRQLRVVLAGSARILGMVRDEQGLPVPGLDLWLAQTDSADPRAKAAFAKARSDENGRFEFRDVPFETLILGPSPGTQEFVARDEPVVRVDRPLVEQDLEVLRGLFLAGRVVGSEQELEGLDFLCVQHLDGRWLSDGSLAGASFRAGPLPPGEYLVSASGAWSATAIVRAAAGSSDVELPILANQELRLRIEGADGPFELESRDLERGPVFRRGVEDGTRLRLAPGRHALYLTAPDGQVAFLAPLVVEQGQPERELVLRLERGARCTFVHRAAEGTRRLVLLVDGMPFPLPSAFDDAVPAGAARSVLVPPRALVAELHEGKRVVARESLAPAPGERLRVELVPR